MKFPPIIYQDEDLIVIDKPAGLVVQMSHTHQEETLEEMLPDTPDLVRRGLVHRLDRDTSGLMVVAKTPEAQQELQRQFKAREVEKEYRILCWGKTEFDHAIIDAPIARHPIHGHKFVVMEDGRPAKTEFWRLGLFRYGEEWMSDLRVAIYTGRTHQIRVHLTALGHPVVGDSVYGRRKDRSKIRQCVHAAEIRFTHPTTKERCLFQAPLATDIQVFMATLRPVDPIG